MNSNADYKLALMKRLDLASKTRIANFTKRMTIYLYQTKKIKKKDLIKHSVPSFREVPNLFLNIQWLRVQLKVG